jgi:hypothetical protein
MGVGIVMTLTKCILFLRDDVGRVWATLLSANNENKSDETILLIHVHKLRQYLMKNATVRM